jgi:SAM-dependent methyltransferase
MRSSVGDWARLRRALLERASVGDDEFDRLYPAPLRRASTLHWTPVRVATRAADLFARYGTSRVLDVGAGVGKFCIVGAARTATRFIGLERRVHLVEAARRAAEKVRVGVDFIAGDLDDVRWEAFDGYYLYNPFYEHLCAPGERVDSTVELSRSRYLIDVERTISGLERALIGTRVVTFHGFGGPMPVDYELVRRSPEGNDVLELWIKRERAR